MGLGLGARGLGFSGLGLGARGLTWPILFRAFEI